MSQQQSVTTTSSNHSTTTNPTNFQNNFNLSDPPMAYTGSNFYVSPLATTTAQSNTSESYFYDTTTPVQQPFAASPTHRVTISPSSIMIQEPPMLVASSSTTTTASTISSSSVEFLNEAFAKATSLPESFYPEFLQYSKETYEQSTGGGPHRRKQKHHGHKSKKDEDHSDEEVNQNGLSSSELRRQIHIQSEQKRRAQIKDGFEELRNELPACLNKKMSKVALLHRTVQHIQHLKDTQMSILSELERLVHENEQLRKFQEGVLQKQALENMYSMTNM
ncbi:hypothetical protein G6F46_003277 [Rhizopus delemar]|uniref:BHLH domain-containing protein n=3 Tax=Rhizopus TaxID=4842 RepID=I1CIR0_RHIO9|nr:hypothetical protein RO3G_13051 [Rhizopus delemar RA 99-880]KAG1464633.1 hypothetical protein G6F55_001652 [Rhizopus delemar]KAG1552572.1 hypothetical protein G6F51_001130 [Rhizopus arrhizus]KAG1501908.1 hypothetical protein G6F54_002716 [Rhizopus delemar]KAG1516268.1 hypothetical protein G6F53_002284 [Rhizopus delemar]|eukprot:EIE88340.1 hypothetical protein RO3G_13051 [Rhizopus delemar RA 99-880]